MIGVEDLDQVNFTDPTTIRLISTAYIDEPAMAPLVDDADDLAILEEIEGLTSARRTITLPVPGGLDPAELLTAGAGYGWTYINAAFCYARATGNRFNGPDRGAWYACYGDDAALTAQAEVSWHLSRELAATGVFENITAYRELRAGFTTRLRDLTDRAGEAVLNPDQHVAYPIGQRLAQDVLGAGGNGLLYPSARRDGGRCLVAFRPHLVQNVRQGETWTFFWSGEAVPEIKRGG